MRGWAMIWGLTLSSAAWASPQPAVAPPADIALARDMLQSLVEINTTHAHGSTDAAKAIQGWLLAAGFAPALESAA